MNKIFSKVTLVLLTMTMLLSIVACGKEPITCELVYATSKTSEIDNMLKPTVDAYSIEYTYKDNVVTMQVPASEIDKIKADLETEKETRLTDPTLKAITKNVSLNEDCTSLIIDYNKSVTPTAVNSTFADLVNFVIYYQAFNGIPADEFNLQVTIQVDGETVNTIMVDKEQLSKA